MSIECLRPQNAVSGLFHPTITMKFDLVTPNLVLFSVSHKCVSATSLSSTLQDHIMLTVYVPGCTDL